MYPKEIFTSREQKLVSVFFQCKILDICNSDWLVKKRAEKGDSPSSWAKDIAWVPFYTVCPVCQLPYTVLKLENPEETEEMLEQLNLKLPQWATPVHTVGGTSSSASKAKRYPWIMIMSSRSKRESEAVMTILRYYGELTRRQIESLVKIFHLDLLLFGYTAQVTFFSIIQTLTLLSIYILGVLGPCQRTGLIVTC